MNTKENVNDLYIYPANFQKQSWLSFSRWRVTGVSLADNGVWHTASNAFSFKTQRRKPGASLDAPKLRRDITFQPAPPAVFLNGNPIAYLFAKKLHFRLFYIFFSTKVTPRSTFSLH